MTGHQLRSNTETTALNSLWVVRNRSNPARRLAFGNTAAAEGFIARAIDPAAWVMAPADTLLHPSNESQEMRERRNSWNRI